MKFSVLNLVSAEMINAPFYTSIRLTLHEPHTAMHLLLKYLTIHLSTVLDGTSFVSLAAADVLLEQIAETLVPTNTAYFSSFHSTSEQRRKCAYWI